MDADRIISALETRGFRLTTSGRLGQIRKLYADAAVLGLEDSGDFPTFCGKKISKDMARRMRSAKTYIDLRDGLAYSRVRLLRERAAQIFAEILRE